MAEAERIGREELLAKAAAIRAAYPSFTYPAMLKLLEDAALLPKKVMLAFNDEPLHAGEFGLCMPLGADAEGGYLLYLHPFFRDQETELPLLIAYQLVVAIWGQALVTHEEAELFGASLCELDVETYYDRICRLTDAIPAAETTQDDG